MKAQCEAFFIFSASFRFSRDIRVSQEQRSCVHNEQSNALLSVLKSAEKGLISETQMAALALLNSLHTQMRRRRGQKAKKRSWLCCSCDVKNVFYCLKSSIPIFGSTVHEPCRSQCWIFQTISESEEVKLVEERRGKSLPICPDELSKVRTALLSIMGAFNMSTANKSSMTSLRGLLEGQSTSQMSEQRQQKTPL